MEKEIIDKEWSPKGSRGPMLNALSRVEMSISPLLELALVRERENALSLLNLVCPAARK